MRQLVPADIRDVLISNRALRVLLLTDFFVLLAELSVAVALPWWVTSAGGAHALAVFSVTLAVATFFVAPAVSPFGDRLCKARQITWGLACLLAVAATQAGLSWAGVFSIAALAALAVLQVLATSFVDPARDTVLTELVSPAQLPAASHHIQSYPVIYDSGTVQVEVNLKADFAKGRKIKQVGMTTAMRIAGLEPKGAHHRALSDAQNIARLLPLIL